MIRFGAVMAAGFAVVFAAAPMVAQTAGGPAENPPPGYTGQQYVDSRGCVFMRAGFSGATTWVPRIGRDRKPRCGEVTAAQAVARLNSAQPALPVQQENVGAPMATVASKMQSAQSTGVFEPIAVPGLNTAAAVRPAIPAQPVYTAPVAATVATSYAAAPVMAPTAAMRAPAVAPAVASGAAVGCPASAPVLQQLPLSTGGSVAVCTRGDGSASGWMSPTYVQSARPGAAITGVHGQQVGFGGFAQGHGATYAPQGHGGGHYGAGAAAGASGTGGYVQTVIAGQPVVTPRREAGTYSAAWKDDRLNPQRGLGTAQGWAAQSQTWVNTTPAQTRSDAAHHQGGILGWLTQSFEPSQTRVTVSSRSDQSQAAPSAEPSAATSVAARIYVQVGTFGNATNAKNAAGHLFNMGLPVASATSKRGGKQVKSIMAGPFASMGEAQRALNAARGAGFGDAFIR